MNSELDVKAKLALDITDHISAMLAYWDKDQVCRFANAAYVNWYGKTGEEIINKMTVRELLGPKLYAQNASHIKAALAGRQQSFEREITTPAGEVRYSMVNYFPKITNGHVDGFISHVADVTPLKELKKDLAKSNETILEQNKMLLDYTNIVSHNLKAYANNLAVILDLCKSPHSEEDHKELLGFMYEISGGLQETVRNLAQLADAPRSRDLDFEEINLGKCIERAVRTLANEIIGSGATIRNNVGPAIKLLGIPAYMDSIMLNLITNAIRFRQVGKRLVIEMDAFYARNELIFFIKDNGMGIDIMRHKADLFGIYKTFHGPGISGKGTGLFLVKQKTETMGAFIEIESEVGMGTVFKIHFRIPEFKKR